ncbi:alpha-1,2-fucosyltransferase [Paenibacillus sp. PAMC21692]|uniref:alpha-1,2-fucosyltransferase n=1 Tax=Paenibacillus sp. PAMC21692 TaxID=2762320 RepID=UPI00164D8435|nr:alpha-1,2-fucosyltransferase [Paenibacillus sp. PAMC21692]QNK58169.1 alpha-1,2-fucosyltransferase [Paenibacillus sp. PAMC21692]
MKIVKFKGGLGNQLFQYAYMRALELKYDCKDVIADLSIYEHTKGDRIRVPRIEKLNVKISKAQKSDINKVCYFTHAGNTLGLQYKSKILLETIFNSKYYFEFDRSYREITKIINHSYFDGYWQSWRYLIDIEEKLREEITPKFNLSNKTVEFIKKIKNENAVFLGVRRGDYIEIPKNRKHYGEFTEDYYIEAINYIRERVDNPVFYIFSNDINWVKKNMNFDCDVVYREDDEQISDVEELFIMGACKHAIIVNSTFYWWGAWLINNRDKIVVSPKQWFADDKPIDIVPDNWVKI